jgi:hypothetical protein
MNWLLLNFVLGRIEIKILKQINLLCIGQILIQLLQEAPAVFGLMYI